jgi:hypothetical protein
MHANEFCIYSSTVGFDVTLHACRAKTDKPGNYAAQTGLSTSVRCTERLVIMLAQPFRDTNDYKKNKPLVEVAVFLECHVLHNWRQLVIICQSSRMRICSSSAIELLYFISFLLPYCCRYLQRRIQTFGQGGCISGMPCS